MKLTATDTLEKIYQDPTLPPICKQVLQFTTTYQERVETDLLTSLRGKYNFAEWISTLLLIDPQVETAGGETQVLSALMQHKENSINSIKSASLEIPATSHLSYARLANTPSDRAILSTILDLQKDDTTISGLKIAFIGANKAPFEIFDISQKVKGKELNQDFIELVQAEIRTLLEPKDTYLASAEYINEMAVLLVGRILNKELTGEEK